MVLPELSSLPSGLSAAQIRERAESRGGSFEQRLAAQVRSADGYLVASYPERDGKHVFHTVVLIGPLGTVLGRNCATLLNAFEQRWASPGDAAVVVTTPLGRVGMAIAGDLSVPEFVGLMQTLRTDVLVVPAVGTWINQQQLIDGQRNDLFAPLVLIPTPPASRLGNGLVVAPTPAHEAPACSSHR